VQSVLGCVEWKNNDKIKNKNNIRAWGPEKYAIKKFIAFCLSKSASKKTNLQILF